MGTKRWYKKQKMLWEWEVLLDGWLSGMKHRVIVNFNIFDKKIKKLHICFPNFLLFKTHLVLLNPFFTLNWSLLTCSLNTTPIGALCLIFLYFSLFCCLDFIIFMMNCSPAFSRLWFSWDHWFDFTFPRLFSIVNRPQVSKMGLVYQRVIWFLRFKHFKFGCYIYFLLYLAHTDSLTYSHAHSLTRSLTHALTHSLIHSPTHRLTL